MPAIQQSTFLIIGLGEHKGSTYINSVEILWISFLFCAIFAALLCESDLQQPSTSINNSGNSNHV